MIHESHLNTGFVRHWKRLYAPVELLVSLLYFSVCLWRLEQVFLIVCPHVRVCVCFVCACVRVSTRIGENPQGQVSVWFHDGVETQGLRLQPGSSVRLQKAPEVKV